MEQIKVNVIDDVQKALKNLGELELKEEKILTNTERKLNSIKEVAEKKLEVIHDGIAALKNELEVFATENKEEIFVKSKQYKTTYGVIKFAISTKVVIDDEAKAIKCLRKNKLKNAIGTREPYVLKTEIRKDKYKKWWKRLGVTIIEDDVFSAVTDKSSLR